MKYFSLIFSILILPLAGMNAQDHIQRSVDQLAADPSLKHASLSICVINLDNGRVVASYEPQRSLVPASALKLISTATAYAVLGEHYTYGTDLLIQGQVNSEGILRGNVIIKGSGDPSLGSAEWEEAESFERVIEKFKLALQQKGIRKIDGFIIGDDSYFSTAATPKSWTLNDLGNYYAAGVHGLNIHDNLYYLKFRQNGQLGAIPPVYSISPTVAGLNIINEVKSAGSRTGDNAYIYGTPFTYLRYIRGSIPIGSGLFEIKGAIPDPPLFAAQQLEVALRRSGIETTQGAISQRLMALRQLEPDGQAQHLLRQSSPELVQIIERTLFKSVNLYAEALVHTLGKVQGKEGNTESGLEVIYDYWKDQNVDMEAAFLEDGSGLSPKNAISAGLMAELLYRMSRRRDFQAFRDAIPLAGRTGSISGKFRGTAAEGRLWAKSGTLARVRTYAGYGNSKGGRQYSFAVLINNYSGGGSVIRQKLDQFLIDLCR